MRVSWAKQAVAAARSMKANVNAEIFSFIRCLLPLESEIKPDICAAAPHRHRRRECPSERTSVCFYKRVVVMKGQSRAAEHDWIPAVTDRVSVNVAEVRRIIRKRLLGHPNDYIALGEDKLGSEMIMGFDKPAVPGGSLSAVGKCLVGGSRGSEIHIVPAVHKEGQELELAGVQVTRETDSIKGLSAQPCA